MGHCRDWDHSLLTFHLVLTQQSALFSTPQVLSLRQEKSKLLGFNNFAELSMSKKVSGRWRETLVIAYINNKQSC